MPSYTRPPFIFFFLSSPTSVICLSSAPSVYLPQLCCVLEHKNGLCFTVLGVRLGSVRRFLSAGVAFWLSFFEPLFPSMSALFPFQLDQIALAIPMRVGPEILFSHLEIHEMRLRKLRAEFDQQEWGFLIRHATGSHAWRRNAKSERALFLLAGRTQSPSSCGFGIFSVSTTVPDVNAVF